jgi:hypothetical protein
LTALNVLRRGSRRPHIPAQFERLDEPFFSLGQDDDYFERLLNLPGSTGEETLVALRDIAFDNTIFEAVRGEDVTSTSLLRDVSVVAVTAA